MNKAVFLDRDGVINVDRGYVHKIKDFEFMPNSIKALKMMQDAGYILIIITSQSGIGIGYYTDEDFKRLNQHMLGSLESGGISITKVYYCPHSPEERCKCRKPSINFIKEAEEEFGIDLGGSFVVGDKTSDIEMGKRAGCRTILVKTGKRGEDNRYKVMPDQVSEDLYSAAKFMLKRRA